MKNKFIQSAFFSVFLIVIFLNTSCSSDDDQYIDIQQSPVVMDLTVIPYPKLSDYNFFVGEIKNQNPVYGLIPYKPSSELFTDYAEKKRFVWLPSNTKATYNTDHTILDLPVGAALVKTFYYNNVQPLNSQKIIETRVMIRKSTGWIFAEYLWNEGQTEAFLQTQASTIPINWTNDVGQNQSINYQIPSEANCLTCHANNSIVSPIGIKPQNLNDLYEYLDGTKNQLTKWVEFGYLENNLPAVITSVVDYNDTNKSLDLRARSYFDANCAHCHQEGGNAEFVVQRYEFRLSENPENLGVCISTNTQYPGIPHGYIIKPNDISQSVLHYTMNTNNTMLRMPRIGRSIIHQEGVNLIEQWVNSLSNCD